MKISIFYLLGGLAQQCHVLGRMRKTDLKIKIKTRWKYRMQVFVVVFNLLFMQVNKFSMPTSYIVIA